MHLLEHNVGQFVVNKPDFHHRTRKEQHNATIDLGEPGSVSWVIQPDQSNEYSTNSDHEDAVADQMFV